MTEKIAVFGYGAVGRAVTDLLSGSGRSVRVVQRHKPIGLPVSAHFYAADVCDAKKTAAAADGAAQIVVAIGFPYKGALWRRQWPVAMANLLAAAEKAGARLVFVDNLYMYGPQSAPLTEDMPLEGGGLKPRARADITRLWLAARDRVRFAAVRAPDFYGPGVGQSILGDTTIAALARNQRATLIVPPDLPHDYAYVPDIARAVLSLLEAPDTAFGQAWHVPCAPIRTTRDLLAMAAAALERNLDLRIIPLPMVRLLGVFVPFLREFPEMRFQWDRPYHVDARKFAARFWNNPTPFETGIRATARSFVV